jgi:queuine tRNA-ribosyltransferase
VAYTYHGPITIKNKTFEKDLAPLSNTCDCDVCQTYSRSYIRHLYKAEETLGARLVSYHNLYFLKTLMAGMRQAIEMGHFKAFKEDFLKTYQETDSSRL